ncbi:MAG: YdcF family protein [Micropepsaceae bacterium]
MIGFAFRVAALVFVLAALGFPIFVWSLSRTSADPGTADAIVALTGGEGRLQAGLDLLEHGKGGRLLISGVHAETTRDELFAAVGGAMPSRAGCCVDLGRGAEDTIGNAGETAAWVAEHNYRSVIVVTATYHMPRSMMELQAMSPFTTFVPYPVFPDRVRLEDWWRDPETTGVLAYEYVKFLGATVRVAAATRFWSQPAALPAPATIERAPGENAQLVGTPT